MIKRRNAKKNRLSDVRVDEVSLVDSPANQKPFFLFKRNGGDSMKMKDDEVLSIFEKASDELSAIVEKHEDQEKLDVLELSKNSFEAVSPVINFCVAPLIDKAAPKDLADDKKEAFVSFVKSSLGNSLTYDPNSIQKQWDSFTSGNYEIFPWIPVPETIKKREEMTEDELTEDLKSFVEVAKAGKKLSKKSAEVIKNAIATLNSLLEEMGIEKKEEKKEDKDPLDKEFESLSKEEQEEVLKTLRNLIKEYDSLSEKKDDKK